MLTTKQFAEMKSRSLKKDPKSAQRVIEDFKAASATDKKAVLELSGMSSPSTVYNCAKSGAVSAKILLSAAQIFNVSPYYYLGATDEKEAYSDEILDKFLTQYDNGYRQ
jgi:hypothetical protein